MRRFTAKIVLSGLVTAWRLAGWPIRRSPSFVKATTDGVVRAPSLFSMTFGLPPSITATQLLVVPRSMPITLAITIPLLACPRRHRNASEISRTSGGDIGDPFQATRVCRGGIFRGFDWHNLNQVGLLRRIHDRAAFIDRDLRRRRVGGDW